MIASMRIELLLLSRCCLAIVAATFVAAGQNASKETAVEIDYGIIDLEEIDKALVDKANVEELTAVGFRQKVASLNKTKGDTPAVAVFFHVHWCEHCKAALPEFKRAAGKLQEVHKQGMKPGSLLPKFYTLNCDRGRYEDAICLEYIGSEFPEIALFRDHRQYRLGHRMRYAEVIYWWINRVTRPPLREAMSVDHIDMIARNETVFLLHVPEVDGPERDLLEAWRDIAFNYMDSYTFLYTTSDSQLAKAKQLPRGIVSVHIEAPKGLELSVRPIVRPVTPAGLKAWVNYNQFPVLTPLHWGSYDILMGSGHTVIALMHGANYSGALYRQQFERKAIEFRAKVMDVSKKDAYLFSAINMSDAGAQEFMRYQFPVLGYAEVPRIFAFSGAGDMEHYWEDPSLNDTRNLSRADIRALLDDREALHENTFEGWLKGKKKLYIRYASRSRENMAIAVGIPVAVVVILSILFQVFCSSLFEVDDMDADVDQDKLSMKAQMARDDHIKAE